MTQINQRLFAWALAEALVLILAAVVSLCIQPDHAWSLFMSGAIGGTVGSTLVTAGFLLRDRLRS